MLEQQQTQTAEDASLSRWGGRPRLSARYASRKPRKDPSLSSRQWGELIGFLRELQPRFPAHEGETVETLTYWVNEATNWPHAVNQQIVAEALRMVGVRPTIGAES